MTGTGGNFAALAGPLILASFIPLFGWRTALLYVACGGASLIVLAAALLHRDPESRGLVSDGAPPTAENAQGQVPIGCESRTLGQAFRTVTLWVILGVFLSTWLVLFFPYVHLPAHGLDLGFGAKTSAGLVGAIGVGGVVGRIAIGWFSDRVGGNSGLKIALAVQSLAFLLLAFSEHLFLVYVAVFAFGSGAGAGISLFGAVIGNAFGTMHIGAISGFLFAIASGASAVGPYMAGFVRDSLGDYTGAFLVAAALNALAVALSFAISTSRPQ
jgi:MFS family permease